MERDTFFQAPFNATPRWLSISPPLREKSQRGVDRQTLAALALSLTRLLAAPTPAAVATLPLEDAQAEATALTVTLSSLAGFPSVARHLTSIAKPPWQGDLPLPEEASRRGVRLFLEVPQQTREIEASTSVQAVVEVAARLAAGLNEQVDSACLLSDADLQLRIKGEWARLRRPVATPAASRGSRSRDCEDAKFSSGFSQFFDGFIPPCKAADRVSRGNSGR